MKPDHDRVNKLLTDTVTLLCKNGLTYSHNIKIQGLIAITLDDSDIFVVQISNSFAVNDQSVSGSNDADASSKQGRKRASSTDEIVDLTRLVETPDIRVQNRTHSDTRADSWRQASDLLLRSQDQQNRVPPPPPTFVVPQRQPVRGICVSNDAAIGSRHHSSHTRPGLIGPRLLNHPSRMVPPYAHSANQQLMPSQSLHQQIQLPMRTIHNPGNGLMNITPGMELGDPMINSQLPLYSNLPRNWPLPADQSYLIEPYHAPNRTGHEIITSHQLNYFNPHSTNSFTQQSPHHLQNVPIFGNQSSLPNQSLPENMANSATSTTKPKRSRTNRLVEHHIDLCDDSGDLRADAMQEASNFQVARSSIVVQPDHLASEATSSHSNEGIRFNENGNSHNSFDACSQQESTVRLEDLTSEKQLLPIARNERNLQGSTMQRSSMPEENIGNLRMTSTTATSSEHECQRND